MRDVTSIHQIAVEILQSGTGSGGPTSLIQKDLALVLGVSPGLLSPELHAHPSAL